MFISELRSAHSRFGSGFGQFCESDPESDRDSNPDSDAGVDSETGYDSDSPSEGRESDSSVDADPSSRATSSPGWGGASAAGVDVVPDAEGAVGTENAVLVTAAPQITHPFAIKASLMESLTSSDSRQLGHSNSRSAASLIYRYYRLH